MNAAPRRSRDVHLRSTGDIGALNSDLALVLSNSDEEGRFYDQYPPGIRVDVLGSYSTTYRNIFEFAEISVEPRIRAWERIFEKRPEDTEIMTIEGQTSRLVS